MGTFSVYNVKDAPYNAAGNGVADDTSAIQSAINAAASAKGVVYLPDGTYKITALLRLPVTGNLTLLGNSPPSTTIKKTTNTNGTTPNRTAPNRTPTITDLYTVDSILAIDHPDNGWGDNVRIENMTLEGGAGSRNTYAIYAPRTSHLIVRNVTTKSCDYGFFTYDTWLALIESFESMTCKSVLSFSNDGSGAGSGTSLTASRVSANGAEIGFDIFGLTYSTFNSCACDNVTSGAERRAYKFNVAHGITLNSCGAEAITGEVIWANLSEIVVNGFYTWAIDGVSGLTFAYLWFEGSRAVLNSCKFVDFTVPRDSYNMIVQNGSQVVVSESRLPANGNPFTSYSNSVVVHLDSSGVTAKTWVDSERSGLITNNRRMFFGTTAPSSGTWNRGDIVYHQNPSAGQYIGWVCVSGGTPGTWKTFGAITA